MTSLFSLPWTKKEVENTAAVLESLDLGGDAELAALLAEIAASGKMVTEDVVVDCQLTQFPVYGSSAHTKQQLSEDEDQPILQQQQPVESSWLSWGGLGGTSVTQPVSDEDDLFENPQQLPDASRATAPNPVDDSDWDLEEQLLWKKVEPTKKSSSEKRKMDKKRVLYRQPLIASTSTTRLKPEPNELHAEDSKLDENGATITPPAPFLSSPRIPSPSSTRSKSIQKEVLQQQQHPIPVDRQHWMPDQLCKQCYACETPFTIVRRRHHCRLCGQVFCNTCSAHFVPTSTDSTGQQNVTVRVCQMCFDHASKGDLFSPSAAKRAVLSQKPADDDVEEEEHPVEPPLVLQISGANPTASHVLHEQIRLLAADSAKKNAAMGGHKRLPMNDPIKTDVEEEHERHRMSVSRQPNQSVNREKKISRDSEGSVQNPEKSAAVDTSSRTSIQEGNRHLGSIAAEHLELMARELLRLHAPLLWNAPVTNTELSKDQKAQQKERMISSWINALLALATRCCATVNPNVKKGDLLDIRPYVKVKVIPGGSYRDCAYISGVLFRKTVSHKRMAREVVNPRIMLLSGGIEFTRTENRIASLETLFEQEDKYMEIMVGKILKLQPDVLLVGRSVSRKAQELLLKAGVILVQHVKSNLLNRISRQTGATVISSTDHVMNQFGLNVLGKCRRFRLVAFRDNEAWTYQIVDHEENLTEKNSTGKEAGSSQKRAKPASQQRSIKALLADPDLSNHERQAALAANRLGEGVLDGCEAVKAGLAKRGVAHTYIMLEGCPKHLGCTVVLRGANRAALKQVKAVFRFLANSAYNLRLETTYLKERGARLRSDFKVLPQHSFSSSLCVDYGKPPDGRKVRPWNGGNTDNSVPRLESGELSALDHQSILITSVWMTEKTQCCPAEVKGICYYSLQDVALGQFLRDSCFNLSLKCQNPNCKKSVLDHSLSFVHNDGLINIMVSVG
jgi:TCP-1/cpn60 chaperonin family/FYVE zinc finger